MSIETDAARRAAEVAESDARAAEAHAHEAEFNADEAEARAREEIALQHIDPVEEVVVVVARP